MGNCLPMPAGWRFRPSFRLRKRSSKATPANGLPKRSGSKKPDLRNNTLPLLLITEATPLSQLSNTRRNFLCSINVVKSTQLDLPPISLGEFLWQQMELQPVEQEAFGIFEENMLTYGQLMDNIKVNTVLLDHLLEPDKEETVLILSNNRTSVVSLLIACHMRHIPVAIMNPNFTGMLVEDLKDIHVSCVFTSQEHLDKIDLLRERINLEHCILIDEEETNPRPGFQSLTDLQKCYGAGGTLLPPVVTFGRNPGDPIAPVLTVWTMGRNGCPKMVHLTNKNLTSSICLIRQVTQLDPNMRILDLLPLHHPFSLTLSVYNSLISGCRLTMLSKVGPVDFLRCSEHDRISVCFAVPSILEFLAFNDMVEDYDVSTLDMIFSVAAPIDELVASSLQRRFPGIVLYNGYGLCEATSITHITLVPEKAPKSIGSLLPNMECKILNLHTGKAECSGRMGEIVIRGPLVAQCVPDHVECLTYLDKYGWLHTGDIGFYDQDENFYVTGIVRSRGVDQLQVQNSNMYTDTPLSRKGKHYDRRKRAVNVRVVPRSLLHSEEGQLDQSLSDSTSSS
uniref:AMP-binding domain-containing protein n=1 Tax=Trichuris muris TaxID=70415 RepID=A0A5S6QC78_TRIMR